MLPPGYTPVHYRPQPRRTPLEELLLRSRTAHRLAVMLVDRLPPGRLRRAFVGRLMLPLSYGAMNRGDFEAMLPTYFTEDLYARFAGDALPGLESEFRGRDALRDAYVEWVGGWGEQERVPVGYAERGDTLVVLTLERSLGGTSGIAMEAEVGQVYRLRRGLACEYVECRSWQEAIRIGGMAQ